MSPPHNVGVKGEAAGGTHDNNLSCRSREVQPEIGIYRTGGVMDEPEDKFN